MLDGNQEQERLKRLREQQLRARNPKKKEQQFQRITADHERRRDRSYTLNDLWKDTPIIIRYMLIGFLLGLALFKSCRVFSSLVSGSLSCSSLKPGVLGLLTFTTK